MVKTIKKNDASEDLALITQRGLHEWQITADSLAQIIALLDKKGAILRINRSIENWGLGLVQKTEDQNFHSILHPKCNKKNCYFKLFLPRCLKTLKSEPQIIFESWDPVLKKHLLFKFRSSINNEKGAQSRCSHAVVIVQDVTTKKQAEDRLIDSYKFLGSLNRQFDILEKLGKENITTYHQAIHYVLETACELTKSKSAIMYLKNDDSKKLILSHTHNITNNKELLKEVPLGRKSNLQADLSDKYCYEKNIAKLPWVEKLRKKAGMESVSIMPLHENGKIFGLAVLFFSSKHLEMFRETFFQQVFSMQASFFLARLRNKKIKKIKK